MDVPSDHIPYLKKAFDGLETGLAGFLQASALDWIIYDFASYWLSHIATKLSISHAFFLIINAWHAVFFGPASALIDGSDDTLMETEQFTIPPKWVQLPT
ncbi:putative UDP-rhamnose:rhamnosyltransferase 1 [Camellia lanceoleosa]|uniref:UDP-rhamnose:rhamnosyltransferase 1 n=1 Tax=Camellia lanceoleosa TaxID=1840588 RepID=A0ACC0HZU2_9ERIC|nr:putative UDP-rhamnose:rhamnosyltransferase 1 [Camellia lanceoleosa]